MRTFALGLTMTAALMVPAGAHGQTAAGDHAAHAGQPAQAASMACCTGERATHGAPSAAAPMACCDHGTAAQAAPMACCDHATAAQPAPMACCQDPKTPKVAQAMACCAMDISNDPTIAAAGLGLDHPLPVKLMEVNFRDPVLVGGKVLMGWYYIEHDDDRMARGEPCTYIYDLNALREPVVTFHCTHLERGPAPMATIVLTPTVNPAIKALAEFQFSNDTASHGVPAVR